MRVVLPLCAFVTFSVLAVLAHVAIADARAIRLTVTPQVSFAPSRWAIQVRVHPVPEDRWISVQTDNGEFSRMSAFTIEGDRLLYTVDWRSIPQGDYTVIAAIGHGDTVRADDRLHATVSGF